MAFNQARVWLDECCERHSKCSSDNIPLLPKRIVDIGNSEASIPRIYISSHEERGRYTALSYCWGGQQDIITKLATINTYTNGLPTGTLPKTIRDAITVTRGLQIRFLWIDALCIIQDSPEDKLREISTMGAIYKNATVTIAAAISSKVSDGFLENRASVKACKMPFYLAADVFGSLSLATREYHTPDDPLFTRG